MYNALKKSSSSFMVTTNHKWSFKDLGQEVDYVKRKMKNTLKHPTKWKLL
jgi:hypothetical protein